MRGSQKTVRQLVVERPNRQPRGTDSHHRVCGYAHRPSVGRSRQLNSAVWTTQPDGVVFTRPTRIPCFCEKSATSASTVGVAIPTAIHPHTLSRERKTTPGSVSTLRIFVIGSRNSAGPATVSTTLISGIPDLEPCGRTDRQTSSAIFIAVAVSLGSASAMRTLPPGSMLSPTYELTRARNVASVALTARNGDRTSWATAGFCGCS